MTLSILIATVYQRIGMFVELKKFLDGQIINAGMKDDVEIVYLCDNKEISVGAKRQKLLELAIGDYVSYIDDDDWVDDHYIQKIVKALETKPDCVGFNVLCDFPNGKLKAVVSNRYDKWENNKDGYDYTRSPNHLAVIKREHVLAIGFKDMRAGEDSDFSHRLAQSELLKTEVFINEYLYTYRFRYENSRSKYGIR